MKRYSRLMARLTTIALAMTIVLVTALNARTGIVNADGPTATAIAPTSPLSIVPAFEQIVPLQASWTAAQTALRAQGYSIRGNSILINDPSNDVGSANEPQLIAGVALNGDQIQSVGIYVSRPILRPLIDGLAWNAIDPIRLITAFGPPVDVEFSLASGFAYYAGYTLYWNTPPFAVTYDLLIQPQDIKGDRFRICLRNDRVIEATLVYESSFSQLYTRFPITIPFKSDMLIGVSTVADLAPVLQRGDCTETYVSRWITISEGRPTWTPFPDYTDTPTPTVSPTPSNTPTETYTPTLTATYTASNTTTNTYTATSTSTPTNTPTITLTFSRTPRFTASLEIATDCPRGQTCPGDPTLGGMSVVQPQTATPTPKGKKASAVSSADTRAPDLYVISADGSMTRRLTTDNTLDQWPAWSPDGIQIVWVSWRNGSSQIFRANADGTDIRPLTSAGATVAEPVWSPDGKQIVFTSMQNSDSVLNIMNADGSGVRLLTATRLAQQATWSPDGKQIAFAAIEDGHLEIHLMNADGTNVRQITKNLWAQRPAWSPDGTQIAFTASIFGNPELFVMNADGSNVQRLTNDSANDDRLAWTPDGKALVFASDRAANPGLYRLILITRAIEWVTGSETGDHDPAVAKDGRIAFIRGSADNAEITSNGSPLPKPTLTSTPDAK